MKKHNWIAALLLILFLLCGCSKQEGKGDFESLFSTAESSFQMGRFFFGGQVLGIKNDQRIISYYDAPMGENTFYSVRVTQDFFGCMPERNITVCILGNSETFPDRVSLEKGKEYLFEAALWMEGEEPIFLLPTFYSSLPELKEEKAYAMEEEQRALCGSLEDYKSALLERGKEAGYSPATVLSGMKDQLKNAAGRGDASYFKEKGFERVDSAALQETASAAAALLKRAEAAEATWEGIGALIK
ncbi:MAG: hypothetical protein IJN80_05745 [Clostridia bacterium]|nr:hypothetical protein [Clostridia bacterium]